MTGFMVGATGGPLGAIAGAGIGWLFGGEVQKTTGLTGKAYRVRRTDGSEVVVRSPGRSWSAGDRVRIVNNRLVADESAAEASQPVSLVTQQ
jgi:outer membrane lipoprotein SlyB